MNYLTKGTLALAIGALFACSASMTRTLPAVGIGFLPDGSEIVYHGTGTAGFDGVGTLLLVSDIIDIEGQSVQISCGGAFSIPLGTTSGTGSIQCLTQNNPILPSDITGTFTFTSSNDRMSGMGIGNLNSGQQFVFGYGDSGSEATVRELLSQ